MSARRVAKKAVKSSIPVRVVVRLRPFLSNEVKDRCVCIDAAESGEKQLKLTEKLSNSFGRVTVNEFLYKFDGCYDETASQKDLYDNELKVSVARAFEGFNTTVLAYGVTSSGKTHTMQGTQADKGMIPRTVQNVLSKKKRIEKSFPGTEVKVSMQYCEIFKDKVWDLLEPKKSDLPVRESADGRIVVSNLSELPLTTLADFDALYKKGCDNRRTGSTNLNHKSSRSHAVVMVHLCFREAKEPFRLVRSKLHLIDLAGSEDNRVTGNKGDRLVESGSINRSLFVLGNVINSLNAGHSRIPFRDAKITRLLQDSLGGKSYSTMIINISPGARHFLMTYATLNFGSKSRNVLNNVIQNTVVERQQLEESSDKSSPTRRESKEDAVRRRSDGSDERAEAEDSERRRSDGQKPIKKRKRESETKEIVGKKAKQSQGTLEKKAECIVSIGKQRLAKELIIEAKQLRNDNKTLEALVLYRASAELIPGNKRLTAKIAQLESQLEAMNEDKKDKENIQRELNALLSPGPAPARARKHTHTQPPPPPLPPPQTLSTHTIEKSRESLFIEHLNVGDEKALLSYAKIGKATVMQIVRARELHRFETVDDLSKIDKSSKWIETFRKQNSLF